MRKSAPRAILFDLEGVVIDTEPLWDASQRIFLERRGIAYDRARVKPLIAGRSLSEGAEQMQKLYGFSGTPQELAKERRSIMADLLEQDVALIPGFAEFFARVQAAGIAAAAATSMERALFAQADGRLRLTDRFFPNVCFAEDAGAAKPAPDVYLHAARAVDCAPEDCVAIEDSPAGIEAAKRAGIQCIALATTFEPELLHATDETHADYAMLQRDSKLLASILRP